MHRRNVSSLDVDDGDGDADADELSTSRFGALDRLTFGLSPSSSDGGRERLLDVLEQAATGTMGAGTTSAGGLSLQQRQMERTFALMQPDEDGIITAHNVVEFLRSRLGYQRADAALISRLFSDLNRRMAGRDNSAPPASRMADTLNENEADDSQMTVAGFVRALRLAAPLELGAYGDEHAQAARPLDPELEQLQRTLEAMARADAASIRPAKARAAPEPHPPAPGLLDVRVLRQRMRASKQADKLSDIEMDQLIEFAGVVTSVTGVAATGERPCIDVKAFVQKLAGNKPAAEL